MLVQPRSQINRCDRCPASLTNLDQLKGGPFFARATHGVREVRYGSVGEFREALVPVVARWVARG